MVTVPVVFIIFNRKDTAQEVFRAIRQARPKKLYVIADGPRQHVENEDVRCRETRRIIEQVDWNCTVGKIFAKENMGCGERISSGLHRVFRREERAIILEDDCVPSKAFFPYCEEMLNRYQYDTRIMHINGSNFGPERSRTGASYFFSKYVHIWGWATWLRAWQHYDYSMKSWPRLREEGWLNDIFHDRKAARYWTRFLDLCHGKRIVPSTWDYQWLYSVWANGGLAVAPAKNLVSNIGLTGVHTDLQAGIPGTENFFRERCEEFAVVNHPEFIIADHAYDMDHFRKFFFQSYRKRIRRKLWRLFHSRTKGK